MAHAASFGYNFMIIEARKVQFGTSASHIQGWFSSKFSEGVEIEALIELAWTHPPEEKEGQVV